MKIFSVKLKQSRELEKMTQQDMADALGIKLSTYQGYEALGTRHREPDLEMVERIATVLNISIDELFGR